ncbi:hypothetical protein Vretimale_10492, partial [Volvox reticuliferus]
NAVQLRPSSPYSVAAVNRGSGGGAAVASQALPARQSTELPQVSSRLRSAMGSPQAGSGSPTGSTTPRSASQNGFGSMTPFGALKTMASTPYGVEEQSSEAFSSSLSGPVALMVIVPAAHLAASLASLVQRPLDTHVPGYIGPTLPVANGLNGLNGSVAGGQGSLGSPGGGTGRRDPGWRDSITNGSSNFLMNFAHHGSSSPSASSSSSFDPFSKLSGVPGLTWSSEKAILAAFNGTHGSVGTTATCASLLQQLPAASSLGDYDQISLALGLDWAACISQTGNSAFGGSGSGSGSGAGGCTDGAFSSSGGGGYSSSSSSPFTGPPTIAAAAAAVAAVAVSGGGGGFSASRLLGIVLSTLSAADHPQYIVRMDSAQAANAVAFERRRAAADASSLNSLAGSIAAGSNGIGGGGGSGASVSSSGGSFSTASAFAAAANAVKAVIGPANPREYFIPLPENPTGAVTITLPMGLVLVDAATLESVSGSACNNGAAAGSAGVAVPGFALRSTAEGGLAGGYGIGGGGGGGLCTSARVAALMPHLLASAAALSHVISAVGLISQILRVAGEQHGLFSVPVLRACLRVFNPSTAFLTMLIQTNTSFAVSPLDNTIYIRKSPSDILRLLQTIVSTLPVKSYGNHGGNGSSNGVPSSAGSMSGGTETISRGRLTSGDSFTGSLSRQGSRQRSNRSLDARASTASGFGAFVTAPTPPPPVAISSSSGPIFSFPPSRRVTTSDLNLRPVSSFGGTQYSYGVPYNQLEKLFQGWYLHVMELSPPGTLLLEEF